MVAEASSVNPALEQALLEAYRKAPPAPTEPCAAKRLCVEGQPMQFGLRAARAIKRGEFLCHYGGRLRHKDEARASADTKSHMRAIPDSCYVLDGCATASRIVRPLFQPSGHHDELAHQAFSGVDPQVDPLGWLANSCGSDRRRANATVAFRRVLGGLAVVPFLQATRDVSKGEELLCVYGNEHNWHAVHSEHEMV
jgi:hypothetical protein